MIPTNLTAQTVQYVFLAVDWIFIIDKTLLFVRMERVGAYDRMKCKTGILTNFHTGLQVSFTFQRPYIKICLLRNGGYLSRPQYVKMEQRCDLNKNTTILIPDSVLDYVFCMMLANV